MPLIKFIVQLVKLYFKGYRKIDFYAGKIPGCVDYPTLKKDDKTISIYPFKVDENEDFL